MGVWGRTADGAAIRIDFAVKGNCWNMEAYCYGNCYGCGCCAKDKRQRYENRVQYLKDAIDEEEQFDAWGDDRGLRAVQERNVKANIRRFKRKLRYYEKKLKGMTD